MNGVEEGGVKRMGVERNKIMSDQERARERVRDKRESKYEKKEWVSLGQDE